LLEHVRKFLHVSSLTIASCYHPSYYAAFLIDPSGNEIEWRQCAMRGPRYIQRAGRPGLLVGKESPTRPVLIWGESIRQLAPNIAVATQSAVAHCSRRRWSRKSLSGVRPEGPVNDERASEPAARGRPGENQGAYRNGRRRTASRFNGTVELRRNSSPLTTCGTSARKGNDLRMPS
jgi:hypothetical protein